MVYKRYSYFRLFVTLAVLAIVTLSIVLTASRKISASVERDIYRRPPLAIVQFDETFELAQRTIMLDDRPRRTLHLRVDDIELDEAGNVTTVARENYIERQLFSSRYPYSVTAVATQFSQAPLIGDYVGVSLALLPVLAIIAGITTLRMVWRITSPLAQLRRALRKQQFMPYFQPIVRGALEN
ncbi:Uncharacterised protein [Serratia entomophila]|uniref:hypothetical protein n=1 Tax=Serratia TaxID=613 RepID=UPI001F4BE654|nr:MULTISPECIES: hypothetical protein [Serratia]ULG14451.1 Spa19 [Serratia proteamaculans]ULG16145.1 Spa19 [Serratia proteamaculans]ULG18929.1 Spa19 [Serratia proteamaculans]CAI1149687.1 Uncharacterised protein [Serratia entomophila]